MNSIIVIDATPSEVAELFKHLKGQSTISTSSCTYGGYSHTEGHHTIGGNSRAEGNSSYATGDCSGPVGHAAGEPTSCVGGITP